jgi:hypothetical protein
MKLQKTKTLGALLLLAMLASTVYSIMPFVNAKSTNVVIPTYAYLQVEPNPVGLGQSVFVSMFLDKVPPTASGIAGDRWQGFTVKVTAPDGTTQTLGPYSSDNVGGANVLFTPTQVGNYTFVFSSPTQTITGGAGYPGTVIENPGSIGDVYGPSTSAPESLTVTQTPATVIPENSLPTNYWQNPVEAFNHNWYSIMGNWLGLQSVSFANSGNYGYNGNFNPYTTSPMSGHIVWTKPVGAGGQLGGEFGGNEASNYYGGQQYQPKFAPIVLNGVLYYTSYPGASSNPQGWVAVDLRTGKTLWTKNTTDILLCGQIYDYVSINQYGGIPYLWATRGGGFFGGGSFYDMFDAFTGNLILTIANVTGGAFFGGGFDEDQYGGLISYFVNSSFTGAYQPRLTMWNSSLCILNNIPGYYASTPQWGPPQGATIDFNKGVQWSAPVPTNYSGNPFPIVSGIFGVSQAALTIAALDQQNRVIVMIVNAGATFEWQTGWQVEAGFSATDGHMLWIKNQTEVPYTTVVMGPSGYGVYTEFTKETMTWSAFSTLTGAQMWGPTTPYANPWGYYDQDSAVIAYGNLYTWTLGGYIYAYNLQTGALNWTYSNGNSGLNTPYGVYPFWIIGNYEATVANGVIYVEVGHNYGPPLFSGAQIYAVNATNGQFLWSVLNFATTSSLPIVDGYMLSLNTYDNQIYCFGKGLTATTVSAPQNVQPLGASVLIQGTVTDQGPGQTCLGIPAAGTPAIADQFMSPWMAYLYEQSPKPMNAIGVPVTLSVFDPNNNTYVIGTTTSDILGNYNLLWIPPVPGVYKITATFAGSNSYFSSQAGTAMAVSPSHAQVLSSAPTSSVAQSLQVENAPITSASSPGIATFFIIALVAIIVMIAVAAVILSRRK